MKIVFRYQPRWPCLAIGFYNHTRGTKHYSFSIILWPFVLEIHTRDK